MDFSVSLLKFFIFQLGETPVCLSLYSDMVYNVADQKPAQFTLFDYYDPEQQVKQFEEERRESEASRNFTTHFDSIFLIFQKLLANLMGIFLNYYYGEIKA